MPYNYLLSQQFLGSTGINLENSIVIFDEAHNVDKVAEEGKLKFSLNILFKNSFNNF